MGLACSTPFAHSRQGSWGAGQADARLPSSFGSGSGRQALRYHSIHSFHLPAAMSRRGRGFVQPPHSVSVRSSRCAVGVTGRLACRCRATIRDRRLLLTGERSGLRGWSFHFGSRTWSNSGLSHVVGAGSISSIVARDSVKVQPCHGGSDGVGRSAVSAPTSHCSRPPTAPPIEARVVLACLACRVAWQAIAVAVGLSRKVVALRAHPIVAQDGGG